VTFVSPQVDSETQTVLAKAILESSKTKFRIAQQVRAQVTWGVREGPVVPVLAVQRINGQFFAFVAEKSDKGAVARQRSLKLGDIVENEYAVLDGIHSGDHLIVSGLQFLQDGAPVLEQIQEKKSGGSSGQTSPNAKAK
jgi:multidrug efflux pump subunit AcrA (membrane-fusion protein)